MTISTIDLTRRLDELERSLPPLPAKSIAFGRSTVRRTSDVVTSVVSDVARRMDGVVSTARTSASTTGDHAKSAVTRTARAAQMGVKEATGQAKAAKQATAELLDDATDAVRANESPRGVAYEEWTKSDLYQRAQDLDVDGRSGMSKKQLIAALRSA